MKGDYEKRRNRRVTLDPHTDKVVLVLTLTIDKYHVQVMQIWSKSSVV